MSVKTNDALDQRLLMFNKSFFNEKTEGWVYPSKVDDKIRISKLPLLVDFCQLLCPSSGFYSFGAFSYLI